MLLSATSLQRLPAGAAVLEFGASDEASTLLASAARSDDSVPLLALVQAPPPRPAAVGGKRGVCAHEPEGPAVGESQRARMCDSRAPFRQPVVWTIDSSINYSINLSINPSIYTMFDACGRGSGPPVRQPGPPPRSRVEFKIAKASPSPPTAPARPPTRRCRPAG